MTAGTYQDPDLVDPGDLGLSALRTHWRTWHRGLLRTTPRSNLDLAAAHARDHHRHHLGHVHRGRFTVVLRDGRRPVAVIPRPLGWFTGRDAVSRSELDARVPRQPIGEVTTPWPPAAPPC